MMHDNDLPDADALRLKVFAGTDLPTKERLGHLIEFVALLDDRMKELENWVTELVTKDITTEG